MPRTRDAEERAWEEELAALDGVDLWRLCEELTIVQAALLIVGRDPGGDFGYVEAWDMHKRPPGYEAAKHAIMGALRRKTVAGRLTPKFDTDINGNPTSPVEDSVDVDASRVEVQALKSWMKSRGVKSGFFFPDGTAAPDYLDPGHPRYAPKLAAAVSAWLAVDDPKGKTPKSGLMKWLRENSATFGLSDEEGKPNELGIEECAKVANWQPGGGAPKTPGS